MAKPAFTMREGTGVFRIELRTLYGPRRNRAHELKDFTALLVWHGVYIAGIWCTSKTTEAQFAGVGCSRLSFRVDAQEFQFSDYVIVG